MALCTLYMYTEQQSNEEAGFLPPFTLVPGDHQPTMTDERDLYQLEKVGNIKIWENHILFFEKRIINSNDY